MEKLNDLDEPSVADFEETYGNVKEKSQFYWNAGRGGNYTSRKTQKGRKQPVRVFHEVPDCSELPALRSRGARSRPAPSRCIYCHEGIHRFARGLGHGKDFRT